MCGIVGAVSHRNVTELLLDGLRRLEYRGYDSAGITVWVDATLQTARAEGKLVNLRDRLEQEPIAGPLGIGHTRWATHGAPTEQNAHPHRSRDVAVVHNGIIENYQSLRRELTAAGVVFSSETDTECIPHLIQQGLDQGLEPVAATLAALRRLEGAFALGILFRTANNLLLAARRGSPLIVGVGDQEQWIGSDATPLVAYTRRMIYLQDDDLAVLTPTSVTILNRQGEVQHRPEKHSQVSAELTEKWPHRHYMQKEIFEQPTVIGETLKGVLHPSTRTIAMESLWETIDLTSIQALTIVACGTSWHAALVAQYWLEQWAGLPVKVDIASEYRYRSSPALPHSAVLVISQSGETADTLAALRYARAHGQPVLAMVNVPESTIAREADGVLYTQAGPEIGVASTKAFTTQLTLLAALAIAWGRRRGVLTVEQERELVDALLHLPVRVEQILAQDGILLAIARDLYQARGFLFLGRGTAFPIALEGALKLKEISYIHAEGYAAGEMKHGPIALIDQELPVVVVAPRDGLFDKLLSNLEEVRARGGRVVLLTTLEEGRVLPAVDYLIPMVACGPLVAPILYVVPLQLLAYHIAVLRGTDVDQPRNLAKSVTVE